MAIIKIDLPSKTVWIQQLASALSITQAKALQIMQFIQGKIEFNKIVKVNVGTEEEPIWAYFHRKSVPYSEYTNVQVSVEVLNDRIAQLIAERDAILAEKDAVIAEAQASVDGIPDAVVEE